MKKFVFQDEEGTFIIRSRDTMVELTEEDMSVFIWFRKYQDMFEKVKELKGGSVTIHKDKDGNIRDRDWHFKERA